jgi:hypothetical protein
MAQLPDEDTDVLPTVSVWPDAEPTADVAGAEPDPSHVGSMLSRFHSGVQRATAESDQTADS